MCMAMMNSVTFRAPRCSVSERFQMRPRTSLGNRAFSKISFAFSPGNVRVALAEYQDTYQRARH